MLHFITIGLHNKRVRLLIQLSLFQMTKSHVVLTPENINLQEWQKTAAKRPFARKGLVKMLRDEYQSQSLYTDTSDDDDADSFVSAVSSVSSLASISDNIHQMELLEDVKLLTEGKQHKSIGWVLVQEDALTKLTEGKRKRIVLYW